MKISNRLKAAGVCVAVFAGAVATSYMLQFIGENVATETILRVIGGAVVAFLFYMMYQVVLARFDYEDSVKKLVDPK